MVPVANRLCSKYDSMIRVLISMMKCYDGSVLEIDCEIYCKEEVVV